MTSEVKVDKLSQKGSSGIVITDDIKLSSGKAIKNAAGTDLLTQAGVLDNVVLGSSLTMTQGSDATGDIYYRAADGTFTRLGAGTANHVLTTHGAGSLPTFAAVAAGSPASGTMRFLSQVYKTGTQNTSSEVMTTGALSVTSGSKILLQFMLNYEDSAAGTTDRFSWFFTGGGLGTAGAGQLVAGATEYLQTQGTRSAAAASWTYENTDTTPTYGVYAAASGSPNVTISASSLTVYEIYA